MIVEDYLKEKHVEFDVIPHRETHDAQRLAQTLHVSGRDVAKTVLLRAGHAYIVVLLPANKTIDFARASCALGCSKVELASETEISERCPDCELGVLPPFGSQYGMKTIVDESLTEYEEIVFEGNTHHEAIRIKFADFRRLEEPLIASFARQ